MSGVEAEVNVLGILSRISYGCAPTDFSVPPGSVCGLAQAEVFKGSFVEKLVSSRLIYVRPRFPTTLIGQYLNERSNYSPKPGFRSGSGRHFLAS